MNTQRTLVAFFVVAMLLWIAASVVQLGGRDGAAAAGVSSAARTTDTGGAVREYGYGLIRFNGRGPERWRAIAVSKHRQIRKLESRLGQVTRELQRARRELRRRYEPSFEHYFTIAARTYADGLRRHGYTRADLERRGRCESLHFTDFYNETPIYNGEHAQGVMGFIPSTFATTPFAGLDVRNDHLANIMAGAWMHSVGRGGEWVCR